MTLRSRSIGAIVFLITLVAGASFSLIVAMAAGISGWVLGASSWFKSSPGWLRPMWYGGLLVAAGTVYFVAPTAVVGGPVSTCEEIPGAPIRGTTTPVAGEEPPSSTAMSTPTAAMNQVEGEHDELTVETEYLVNVEPAHVSYIERVDLHLSRGHFVNLDLTELGLQAADLGPGTQILVGGDGLVAETFTPDQLSGPLRLSTRPRSVWIETRMQVPPGAVRACRGVSLLPFERVHLVWPQRFDAQIRGLTQLPSSGERVPFTQRIEKNEAKLTEVLLPRYSLFIQEPVQLKPSQAARIDGVVADRFEPVSNAVSVADLSITAELLPDSEAVRNQWVYERRGFLFPVNWVVALLYVLVASAIGDLFLSRRG